MPNRPHRSSFLTPPVPTRPPKYTLDYYTPASVPPARPGWYFCVCTDRRLVYCHWQDGFWQDGQRVEVEYYVELPGFIERVLEVGHLP